MNVLEYEQRTRWNTKKQLNQLFKSEEYINYINSGKIFHKDEYYDY